MAESKTVIGNLALSNIKQGEEVADFDTEKTPPARALKRVYDECLAATLRDFDWGFARSRLQLPLVAEKPMPAWAFAHAYPEDCSCFRAIEGETEANPIPWEIWRIDSKRAIVSNVSSPVGIYTALVTDTLQYPADFTIAFSWRISVAIAPALTKAEDKVAIWALGRYREELSQAAATAANESRKAASLSSSFSRSRGWGR